MSSKRENAARAVRGAGVAAYIDAPTRASAERDFGNIAKGDCLLVAEPKDVESCGHLLAALGDDGVGCTLRGAGYSQSGQSVAHGSVTLSTRRIDEIGTIREGDKAISVGGGVTLRRVLQALEDVGATPPALPLNLDMTVGGLLSAGGIGALSHRYGPVVANVPHLRVVTGDGEVRACSRDENPELYHAVLGGLGQCGLIAEATLAVRQAPRQMRVLSLLYDDRRTWLDDQRALSLSGADIWLEGLCWASAKGARPTPHGPRPFTHWMYGLHVAVNAADTATLQSVASSIRPLRKLDEHDVGWGAYIHRYEPRFAGMIGSGAWASPHPWFEAMLPLDRVDDFLGECLDGLPSEVGDGHRLMLVDPRGAPDRFACPAGERAALFGMLPMSVAEHALPRVLSYVEELTRRVLALGGRRYLSGWLGADPDTYLRAHFGPAYEPWSASRRAFDPKGVFRSTLFPNGNRS